MEERLIKQHYLKRSDKKDLSFYGVMLASVSNKHEYGREHSRWDELTIYHAHNGFTHRGYILYTSRITMWKGEYNEHYVTIYHTASELADGLFIQNGIGRLEKSLLQEAAIQDRNFEGLCVAELEEELE